MNTYMQTTTTKTTMTRTMTGVGNRSWRGGCT